MNPEYAAGATVRLARGKLTVFLASEEERWMIEALINAAGVVEQGAS